VSGARIMEDECEGKWKANNIRQMFKLVMGKNLPTDPKLQPTPEEVFRKKYNAGHLPGKPLKRHTRI
jgi:hypothetical protein